MNLELRPFQPAFAPTVVSWVRSELDLLWLAPRTPPPLTPQKVLDWNGERNTMYLMHADHENQPCGYGEINHMRNHAARLWLGHVIVDPRRRGRGMGAGLVRALLAEAFDVRNADSVSLVVFPANTPAVRCYVAEGFAVTREEIHSFRPRCRHRMMRMDITRPVWLDRSMRNAESRNSRIES